MSTGIPLWLLHITGIILASILASKILVMCEGQSGMMMDMRVSARNVGVKSISGLTVTTPPPVTEQVIYSGLCLPASIQQL